jgi:uncharacterized glyoxalase superfamily protein PhnB
LAALAKNSVRHVDLAARFFDGRCEEAVAFYRGALGAEVTMLMRFKDSPEPQSVGGERSSALR